METPNKLDIDLYPKQWDFINATEREVLYCGAAGAGKSHAAIMKVFLRAQNPKAREGVCRRFNRDLTTSFVEDWKRLIPDGVYELRREDQIIRIKGGGTIMWFGVDEPSRLGSRQMTGCLVEEAYEVDKSAWQKILTLTGRLECELPPQVYGVTNPSGNPYHWMIEHFNVYADKAPSNRRYIRTIATDIGAKEDFLESMRGLSGADRKRLFEGLWCSNSGLVYDNFTDENIRQIDFVPVRTIIAIDDGFPMPFVALRLDQSAGGRVHITGEFYQKGVYRDEDKIGEIRKLSKQDRMEAVVVDAAAAALIHRLWDFSLPAVKCKKGAGSIVQGANRVRGLLPPRKEGKPRLTIDPSCTNTIREFRTWNFKEETGEPENRNNHAMDALRYGLEYLDRGDYLAYLEGRAEEEAPSAPKREEGQVDAVDLFDDSAHWRSDGFGLGY